MCNRGVVLLSVVLLGLDCVYIFLCRGENNKSTLILDIDDLNMMHVFASKGTQDVHLNLNLQEQHSD